MDNKSENIYILKSALYIIFFSFLALMLEQIFVFFAGSNTFMPPFLLLVLIFCGFKYGSISGALVGFIYGIVYSSIILSEPGIHIFIWLFIGWFSGKLKNFFYFEKFSYTLIPLIIILILESLFFKILSSLFDKYI